MSRKTAKIIIFLLLAAVIFSAGYFALWKKYAARLDAQKAQLEQEVEQKAVLENIEKETTPEKNITKSADKEESAPEDQPAKNIPEKFILDIPFYSQAPLSKWDAFHEEMCEEASVLNAAYYLLGKKPSKEEYEAELQKIQNAEQKEIGEWKSTTIAEIKKLVDIYFEGKVRSEIVDNPSIADIESEIAAGRPVVVPLSGRDIGNPNFKAPGPIYHMLVVKGYDENFFVTNDVGTRKGDSYVYKKEVIMKNIYDWNEKDIHLGEKKVLVLYKSQ